MKKKNSGKELLQKLGTLMALALLVLIFCVMMPDKFPRISNIMNIFKQASINCLIASGMLCALITAGIDLSVGSALALVACIGAQLAKAVFEWTDSLVTLWPSIDAVSRTGEFWRILRLARTFTDVIQ